MKHNNTGLISVMRTIFCLRLYLRYSVVVCTDIQSSFVLTIFCLCFQSSSRERLHKCGSQGSEAGSSCLSRGKLTPPATQPRLGKGGGVGWVLFGGKGKVVPSFLDLGNCLFMALLFSDFYLSLYKCILLIIVLSYCIVVYWHVYNYVSFTSVCWHIAIGLTNLQAYRTHFYTWKLYLP